MDVGRVNKTPYLLNYIDDEDYPLSKTNSPLPVSSACPADLYPDAVTVVQETVKKFQTRHSPAAAGLWSLRFIQLGVDGSRDGFIALPHLLRLKVVVIQRLITLGTVNQHDGQQATEIKRHKTLRQR